MSTDLIRQPHNRRAFADAALAAITLGLVLSLAVAITTVSIGIARADAFGAVAGVLGATPISRCSSLRSLPAWPD